MPAGTKVELMYRAILKKALAGGLDKRAAEAKAARISQAQTGLSLATGKKPKRRSQSG